MDNAVTDNTATENVGAEKQKLFPTDIGMVVNDFLVEHFPTVVDSYFSQGGGGVRCDRRGQGEFGVR